MESRKEGEVHVVAPHFNADLYREYIPESNNTFLDHIAIHPDGTTVLCGSNLIGRYWDGNVEFFSSPKECIGKRDKVTSNKISMRSSLTSACFLSESKKVVLCDDSGMIYMSNGETWAPSETGMNRLLSNATSGHDDVINTVSPFSDFNSIITASSDCCIKVWDLNTMNPSCVIRPAHMDIVSEVSCHPDSSDLFLSCSLDSVFSLWSLQTPEKRVKDYKYGKSGVRCICWLTDKDFAIGTDDGNVLLYNTSKDDSSFVINLGFPIHRLIFSAKSSQLAVCGDSTKVVVLSYSSDSLKIIHEDNLHTDYVRGLAWDPSENNNLYSSGWDGKVASHVIV